METEPAVIWINQQNIRVSTHSTMIYTNRKQIEPPRRAQ